MAPVMEQHPRTHLDGPPRKGISLRLKKRALRLGLPLIVALTLTGPGGAWAADTVTYTPGSTQADFTDDSGEGSNLTITLNQGSVVFAANDGDTITEASTDCSGTGTTTVTCTNAAIEEFFAGMEDGSDTVVANGNRG